MKQVYITKEEFLANITLMNKKSLVSRINGETYFISRRVFNTWMTTQQCPIFVINKPELKGTKWLAVPLTV